MQEDRSTLYAKLLGETAAIDWPELQPFFARGVLLRVGGELDLVDVALAVASDEGAAVAAWMKAGSLGRLEADQAQDWHDRRPSLWAVVVAPWVLVQERTAAPTH
ncbi:DUF2288 domain-containing protein [Stutzerimonas urumqiensis]|uniref:DUF2288 domain-containing protein n=1 Tax=Stutzerimonas urumqiensis TaxID=638269 RepID=UPI000EB2019C|nr:DUF2288 domain-containing protein [Stutzerimonas urumqiensis]